MNCAVKLLLVAALALMLVPYSFGNEWLPPDIIKMFETPALQPDSSSSKDIPTKWSANNPMTLTNPALQRPSLNEWVPLAIMGTWVFPVDP